MRKRSAFIVAAILGLLTAAIVPATVSAGQTVTHVYEGGTIQAAIDAASAGDKIIVHPGTYYENVMVDKSVSLKAVEGAVVDAGAYRGFSVVASDVSIQGFVVTGIVPSPPKPGAGIYIARGVTGCMIKNNVIDSKLFGIRVFGDGNTIMGNECSGSSSAGIGLVGSNNEVTHNVCHNNVYGIGMTGNRNLVSHNKCYDNTTAGIVQDKRIITVENVLMHNACYNNEHGIICTGIQTEVAYNLCYGNQHGIRVTRNHNTFENNICRDNSENGLLVEGSENYFDSNIAKHNLSWDLYDVGLDNVYVKNIFGTEGP
ncbi:nitrous oxide reductase family maturation protein NosD [Chloroflexota bacterium]